MAASVTTTAKVNKIGGKIAQAANSLETSSVYVANQSSDALWSRVFQLEVTEKDKLLGKILGERGTSPINSP